MPDAVSKVAEIILRCLGSASYYTDTFNAWQRHGFHVTPVHFYSPIPDTSALPHRLWDRPSELPGLDLNVDGQLQLLRDEFPRFAPEYNTLPLHSDDLSPSRFHFNNGMFDGTDALALYCMIRFLKPKLVLEIGSGYSSRLTAEALIVNESGRLVCVEPYADPVLRAGFRGLDELVLRPVQELGMERFEELETNDVLFIDSSHVSRVGGDVNFLYLEVLPRLKPGVVVHIHDIFLPHEYPEAWVKENLLFWNEQYLLHAFLLFNSAFKVLLSNSYLGDNYRDDLKRTFPNSPWHGGGSFWMQRSGTEP